jgi:hypothetical protein
MLDRTTPPPIRQLSEFSITRPDRRTMKNGMPLNIIHAGTEDVVRFDLLIGGGQWNQEQPLQAMFANRMLREGAGNLTSSQIAERLDYYGAWLELSSSVDYGFITLYSLNKYFARTLAVISEMIKAPTFPAKELSVLADTTNSNFWGQHRGGNDCPKAFENTLVRAGKILSGAFGVTGRIMTRISPEGAPFPFFPKK